MLSSSNERIACSTRFFASLCVFPRRLINLLFPVTGSGGPSAKHSHRTCPFFSLIFLQYIFHTPLINKGVHLVCTPYSCISICIVSVPSSSVVGVISMVIGVDSSFNL